MKQTILPKIRKYLREKEDGATANELAAHIGSRPDAVRRSMREYMPDVYIDRWVLNPRLRGAPKYSAVWCVVQVPENCPRPE